MLVASRVQRHSEQRSWEFAHWTHRVIRILYQLRGSDELKMGRDAMGHAASGGKGLAVGFPVWEGG